MISRLKCPVSGDYVYFTMGKTEGYDCKNLCTQTHEIVYKENGKIKSVKELPTPIPTPPPQPFVAEIAPPGATLETLIEANARLVAEYNKLKRKNELNVHFLGSRCAAFGEMAEDIKRMIENVEDIDGKWDYHHTRAIDEEV